MRQWFSSSSPLPEAEFDRRHRGLVCLLAAHLVGLVVFGVAMGWSLGASLLTCVPGAAFGSLAVAPRLGRQVRATCCVVGLLCCSAALVWLWHGQTEAHFDYFVMVGAVALYEAWVPFAIAIAFVVLQHGLMSLWMPGRVYGSMVAMRHPWLYACIHGGFIAALAAADLVYWRANARNRLRERQAGERETAMARRLQRAFAGAPNGTALLDDDGVIVTANEALARSLRTSPQELVGGRWIDMISSGGRDGMAVSWPPDSPGVDRERRVRRGDGSEAWLLVSYSRLGDDASPEWVAQTLDITRRRDAETRLEHEATHDSLTGLLNRHAFAAHARQLLEQESRSSVCILFIDVDDFKVINDSLGHDAGDDLLVAIADRLRSVVRRVDLIGRFGGDEFVICLQEPAPDDAEATARRITNAFADTFPIAGVERIVTASVGLALARAGEDSMDSLLRDADLAMYEAKIDGKARHAWFDTDMRARAIDRLEIETDLRHALATGQIAAHYQPQVDPEGRVLGFEALARWNHPTRGPVSPGAFIPVAEHSGLVSQIGAHVLRQACHDLARWQDADPRFAELRISSNVSARCICNEQLPSVVAQILQETGIPPRRVCLEITETAIVEKTDRAQRVVHALTQLGVGISIDDFGVGHSSLAQLTRVGAIDELKIDKTLIDNIVDNPAARRIVRATIDIAVGSGLGVVAEGVETTEQLDILRRFDCPTIQGFLFSAALPPQQFRDYARGRLGANTETASTTRSVLTSP